MGICDLEPGQRAISCSIADWELLSHRSSLQPCVEFVRESEDRTSFMAHSPSDLHVYRDSTTLFISRWLLKIAFASSAGRELTKPSSSASEIHRAIVL